VTACIAIFEASGEVDAIPSYVDTRWMLARGELIKLCKEALARGPKTAKELALQVMAAKGLGTGNKVLAQAMAAQLIHTLRQLWRRGLLNGQGKMKGGRIWNIAPR
jgi:hypothetical protein